MVGWSTVYTSNFRNYILVYLIISNIYTTKRLCGMHCCVTICYDSPHRQRYLDKCSGLVPKNIADLTVYRTVAAIQQPSMIFHLTNRAYLPRYVLLYATTNLPSNDFESSLLFVVDVQSQHRHPYSLRTALTFLFFSLFRLDSDSVQHELQQ